MPAFRQEVAGLSWWAAYRNTLGSTGRGFHNTLMSCMTHGLAVGNAHGDMGAANLLRDRKTLWVYDWENYCDDAPLLADEIGFYMAINFTRNPSQESRQEGVKSNEGVGCPVRWARTDWCRKSKAD